MNFTSPILTSVPFPDSNELLRQAEDLLQYGSWTLDLSTGEMACSKGMFTLMGYDPATTESKPSLEAFLKRLPEEDARLFQQEIERALDERKPFRLIHAVSTGDGNTIQALSTAKLIERSGQSILLGVTQDVTHNTILQQEVVQQRRLMDQYERLLKFGTWQYISSPNEFSWSTGMYILFGYDPIADRNIEISEELYRKHIDPADYQKGMELRHGIVEDKDKNEYFWQFRITTTTGESKWLETYGSYTRDKAGKLYKTYGLTRDITHIKSYEHSLEMKIRELNRSNAELEEFAYVASHDMQEPLRKIITFSERLTAKYADVLKDEGKMYIDRMVAATKNMRLLIDNLLDFSRISRTGDAFEKTDLNEVLAKAISDLEVSIDETKAEINVENLPEIEAQTPLMKQLFTNIISNALKFHKPDVSPRIDITCHTLTGREKEKLGLAKQMNWYRLDFADNGIGFEQEYAQRIFQIFQRLHGKAEYPGSGIGLAICKKIVDYHNGVIYAEGRINEGAVITIILPEKH